MEISVVQATPAHAPKIIELCRQVYPDSIPWSVEQLASHSKIFPEGQLVAIDERGATVGYAASLIVFWDVYDFDQSWRDFTDHGYFTNHDPARGRTLYGAEIMVDPRTQGKGVGSKIYTARESLTRSLGLLRIRAGARLRGYKQHAKEMTPHEYVLRVVNNELRDPTLSFQLKHGFQVLAITNGYLRQDPESLGNAAVIEWLNRDFPRSG